jgi:hypothetical protein
VASRARVSLAPIRAGEVYIGWVKSATNS